MDIIDEIISSVFGAFLDAFIYPLFNAIKPLLILAIIVVAIIIVIYVGKAIYNSNKDNRKERKYIKAMKARYDCKSKRELEEIYDFLMRIEKTRKKAAENNARASTRDEQRTAVISEMACTMMQEELLNKYPFIEYKYRHHDMAYLKKIL